MFVGIIKNTGKVHNIYKSNKNCFLEISSNMKFSKKEIGTSIACSGACLTLDSYRKKSIKFYLSKETLNRTTFKKSKKGDIINLEKSLKFGQRISGHFVQGHVDTICKIKNIKIIGKSWLITFILEKKYRKYIVDKGSISINGVSLTISEINKDGFKIAVIPKTLELTNIIYLKKNDFVNVEFDILGKYIKNLVK